MSDPTPDPVESSDSTSPVTQRTHPDFAKHEDIILRSDDMVLFNIARRDLDRTSGWFRDMFSATTLIKAEHTNEEIAVSESAETLQVLLKLALGLEFDPELLVDIAASETALRAAIKYEMSGVVQTLKLHLSRVLRRSKDPIKQYVYCCRYDLEDLRGEALDRCAQIELDFTGLNGLDSQHVAQLVISRHERADAIQKILSDPGGRSDPFNWLMHGSCTCCREELPRHVRTRWEVFIKKLMRASVKLPSVDGLLRHKEIRPAYEELIATTCSKGKLPFIHFRELLQEAVARRVSWRVSWREAQRSCGIPSDGLLPM